MLYVKHIARSKKEGGMLMHIPDNRIKRVAQVFARMGKLDKILDIGCNTGSISLIIKKVTKVNEVYGIDVSPIAIKSARTKGINAIQVDIDRENLPFDNDSFDAIYCGEIIEHLHDPDHLLDEVHRTLKVGCACIIDTPNLASWHNRIALLFGYQPSYTQVSRRYNVGKIARGKAWRADSPHPHLWVFTYRSLKELVEIHNFRILETLGTVDSNITFPLNIIEKICSTVPSLSTAPIFVIEKI